MSTKKLQIIGGNFGGNSIQTDDTLTKVGHAADAKATGDAINQLQASFDDIAEIVRDLDGEYYTESEIDSIVADLNAAIDSKSNFNHVHDDLYYTENEIDGKFDAMQSVIDSKVDAKDGKGLSTNDYTDEEQQKLKDIESGANFYEHPAHSSHDLGLYKVTVDGEGHVSEASLVEKADIITFVEKDDILALGIPDKDVIEEEISDLSDRIDDVENNINTTNETLEGVAQDFENYKTTNNEAVSTNASGIEANKTAIEAIQGDYLTSTDKTQLQDDISKVSEKTTANASAIEILNGEGNGSVKQSIDNAFNEFAANVTNDDVINTYKELIDYAAAHGPEFTELVGKVDTIDTHVGEIETDISSYKTAVSDQFNEFSGTINDHVVDENNPHNVTKDQIGLDQVDNTSDMDKPISNAVEEALQEKADVEHMHEVGHIDGLQDLLEELQSGIDINAANIDTKADAEHAHDDLYYDKEEILGLITVEDIYDICASTDVSGDDIDLVTMASKYWVEQYYQQKGNYLTEADISSHDTATDAHNDIRLLIDELQKEVDGKIVDTDNTLSKECMAADAKAVGDALAGKQPIGNYVSTSDLETLVGTTKVSDQISGATTTDSTLIVQLGANGTVGGYKTGDVIAKGTDVMAIINKLLRKAVPASYTNPKISLAAQSTAAGSYEYGKDITAQVKATFTKNDAGVVQSITILKDGVEILTGTNDTLTSNAETFQLTSSVSYTASATYKEGAIKNNNLGEASPDGHIVAGTVTSSAVTFTPYRQGYFYGVLATDKNTPLTSDIIRSGIKKNGAYAAGTLPLISASSVDNRRRIFVACPATNTGVTKVVMPSAQGADATKDFVKQSYAVVVEGENHSTGIAYNVWVYEPALISDDQTFTVTLG
jgi:hypothetical protein